MSLTQKSPSVRGGKVCKNVTCLVAMAAHHRLPCIHTIIYIFLIKIVTQRLYSYLYITYFLLVPPYFTPRASHLSLAVRTPLFNVTSLRDRKCS